jgi:hypothetical protein
MCGRLSVCLTHFLVCASPAMAGWITDRVREAGLEGIVGFGVLPVHPTLPTSANLALALAMGVVMGIGVAEVHYMLEALRHSFFDTGVCFVSNCF